MAGESPSNTSFNAFMGMILYPYNMAFTLKTIYRDDVKKNK
jgi:hypothetical protein